MIRPPIGSALDGALAMARGMACPSSTPGSFAARAAGRSTYSSAGGSLRRSSAGALGPEKSLPSEREMAQLTA